MDDIHTPTVASGPSSRPHASTANGPVLPLPQLIAQKTALESELFALGSVLDSHNVTMSTSLTTFDGYPRADLDIAQIRTTRARIIRLKNDHKALMKQVEIAVQEAFASGKTADLAQIPSTNGTSTASTAFGANTSAAIEPPFARVNTVVPGSPAEQAGLKAGDKIVKFGSVNWTNHERLSRVAQVVQAGENSVVDVRVLRESEGDAASRTVDLRLTPRRDWGGRGLLGCHLVPL